MTRRDWQSLWRRLPAESDLRQRIEAVGKATKADEFDVFVAVSEAIDDEMLAYSVDLIERTWR